MRGSAFPFSNAETGEPAVLVRTEGGELFAYSAVCTHQRCIVAYQPESEKLVCPCHGSVFDPANGAEVEAGPAPRPLPELPIEVRSGRVFLA
jgi:Rieske Fe-S protein